MGEEHFEHNMRVTTAEDVTIIILGKFSGRVEFSDSPSGFFGFLRDFFAQLAKEEEVAADWEGLKIPEYPSFGHKHDTHEDAVKDFYSGWSWFSTKKTFAWKDVYRMNEAPDRRVRRIMEKENKKLREDGIREFNDAVRTLVAFVRKRDPRYTPSIQTDAERQKVLRDASAAQAARARAANAALLHAAVPDWTKARDPDGGGEIEEKSEEEEQFECVACHKTFKSENQFEAHERSKKHQKAVHALRRKMHKDNAKFNLDEEGGSSGIATPQDEESEQQEPEHVNGETMPKVEDLHLESYATSDQTDNPQLRDSNGESDEEEEDSDYAPNSSITSPLAPASTTTLDTDLAKPKDSDDDRCDQDDDDNQEESAQPNTTPKLGKAAQKRAKKAAKQTNTDPEALRFTCAQCNAVFPSRTRLFQHIKDFKHAAPVSKAGKGKVKK